MRVKHSQDFDLILPDPVVTGFGPIIQQLSFKAYSDTADGNDELTIGKE